jgi:hypothetical protein
MKRALLILFLSLRSALAQDAQTSVIIAVGAGGEREYAETFAKWAVNWQKAAAVGGAVAKTIGLDESAKESLTAVRQALQNEPKDSPAELWLVLLGHGNPESGDAKFNLTGDDLSATELATLLQPFTRPVVVIAAFSSSGGFLAPLSAAGRVIVTATKSGSERNYARFGAYLSEAIADPAADLDKDGQTSLLEAWLSSAASVAKFYESEGRLATEHSLLDDNGDGKGTPADWFRGVRVVKKAKDNTVADGLRAHQLHLVRTTSERALSATARVERDALEIEVARLRESKTTMPEDAYFQALETLLLKLARLYEKAEPPAK